MSLNLKIKIQQWAERKLGLGAWARFLGGGGGTTASGPVLANALTQVPWIYAAVTAKATKLGGIPLFVAARNSSAPMRAGDEVRLLSRPSPFMDQVDFVECASLWLDMSGEFFLVGLDAAGGVLPIARGGQTRHIKALKFLCPDRMAEIVEQNQLMGWRYRSSSPKDNSGDLSLLPEEVVHCRLPNPFNYWRGLSPLTVARLAAETDFTAASFMHGLLANNADTGVIVRSERVLSLEEQEQVKAALRERKRAAGTPDRPLLLAGGMTLEKPALSAADMQFLENRKFARQEILAVFRVPQDILGFTEDANRSVSAQQAANWFTNVIIPLASRVAGALAIITAPAVPYFDFDQLPEMQAARLERVDSATQLFNLGVPLNHINRELDLGFPEYAWGEIGLLPFSIQPANRGKQRR